MAREYKPMEYSNCDQCGFKEVSEAKDRVTCAAGEKLFPKKPKCYAYNKVRDIPKVVKIIGITQEQYEELQKVGIVK